MSDQSAATSSTPPTAPMSASTDQSTNSIDIDDLQVRGVIRALILARCARDLQRRAEIGVVVDTSGTAVPGRSVKPLTMVATARSLGDNRSRRAR